MHRKILTQATGLRVGLFLRQGNEKQRDMTLPIPGEMCYSASLVKKTLN